MKDKTFFELLNNTATDEDSLYRSEPSSYLTALSKPTVKKELNNKLVKAKKRPLPQKDYIKKIIKAYSPKPQPRTVESMGARRKKLSQEIRNNKNAKPDVLREYYDVSEAIDKEITDRIDRMDKDIKNL